jgi:uncharacterized damage-inducible protein DinB
MVSMEAEREVLTLEPMADHPEVGRWLSAMDDARRETLRELEGVSGEALDWRPAGETNTIGTLLYHIALVEADWLLVDMLGPENAPPWPAELLPYVDRDDEGMLTVIQGVTLPEHLDRLAAVREMIHHYFRPMTPEDFHSIRRRERFDVSPAWILHHLLQHEAEHRSQIVWLREAYLRQR